MENENPAVKKTSETSVSLPEINSTGKLRAEKLILRNFKSFRKADLPLSKGFTAIVGANGSGKSNVLDALMFVLGATSLKSMRVARLSELINHDAEDSSARVEIVFRKGGHEIRIARKIDSSGKSIYRLNDKRVSLNEVNTFLGSFGIRADGHNIVAQGDITKIIDMSPKQRREIIDEIAGIREYEDKKSEALKKLDKVEKKISDIRIVINERKKYLEQIEKERESALRYNELQEEAKKTKATVIAEEIKVIKNDVKTKEKRIETLEKDVEAARQEKNKLRENETGLEKRNEELTEKIIRAGEKTYSEYGKAVEENRANIRITEEKLRNNEEKINRTKRDEENKKNRITSREKVIEEYKTKIRANTARLNEINALLKPLELKKSERREVFENRYAKLKEKEVVISDIDKKLDAEKKGLFEKESKVREAKRELQIIKDELKALNENTERLGISKRKKKIELFLEKLNKVITLTEKLKEKVDEESKKALLELNQVTKEIAKETGEMNDNLAELAGERKAKEYGERITQLTKEIEKRETEVPAANSAVKKAETEKMNIQEQVHEIKEAINALLMKETQEQYDKLITEKNRLNEDNAALKSNIENALNHIKELNSEISRDYDSHIDNEKTIEERKSIIGKMKEELRKKEAELEKNSTASRLLEEERQRILTKIKNTGEKIDTITNKVEQGERKINEIHLEFSKNEVRLSDLEQEFEEYKEVKPVEGKSLTALKSRFIEIEKEIKSLGAINMKALEDFKEIEKEVNEVAEKANKLETEKNSVVDLIGKIENRKTNVFMECFTKISEKFSEMYYEFFEGQGNLQLSNPERLFDGGLLINAKYKGDKLKSIDAMSGGEKTLTALAFIFAIQDYEAAPFYVLDEADAALDLTNSTKFVKLILNHSKITQFIVVTHNDIITKECDQIIGVAMNKQKSSVIGLRLKGKTV